MEDQNASFWLPSYFLTDNDDDDKKLHRKTSYDLFNDNDENILDDLTTTLARTSLLDSERAWLYSTSPQSTLTGFGFSSNGSPNGPSQVPSPPLTPELKNDAAWELLYEAAGQVARLKMNAIAAQMNNRSLLGVPRHNNSGFTPLGNNNKPTNLYNKQCQDIKWAQQNKYCNHHLHHHHDNHLDQRRSCGSGGTALGLPQSAWPPLTTRQPHHNLNHNHNHRQTSCGSQLLVGEVKRQSVGTGVFIPRKVSTSPPRLQHHHHYYEPQLTEFGRKPTEIMMERRNAILGQQRRNNFITRTENNTATLMGHGHEIRLPSDWTY